jgi:hypothetical protein
MRFFVLENVAGSSHGAEVSPVEPQYKEALTCPACARPLSEKEWHAPHKAEIKARGSTLGDVLFAPGLDVLLSSKFLEAYRAEKLNGLFGLREVEVVKVKPKKAMPKGAKYFLGLAGFGMTQINEKKSRITREGEVDCLQCMGGARVRAVQGYSIDEATWSGEDFFVPWGYGDRLVVSERVLALRDKHELTNMHFVPTEEYVWEVVQF